MTNNVGASSKFGATTQFGACYTCALGVGVPEFTILIESVIEKSMDTPNRADARYAIIHSTSSVSRLKTPAISSSPKRNKSLRLSNLENEGGIWVDWVPTENCDEDEPTLSRKSYYRVRVTFQSQLWAT